MTVHAGKEAGFDICLDYGKQGEKCVDNQLAHLYRCSTCEVKTDAMALQTGRIFVEYSCQHRDGVWRPSGIAITEAHLFAFVFGDTGVTLIFPTEALKSVARPVLKARGFAEHKTGENPTKGVVIELRDVMYLASQVPFGLVPNDDLLPRRAS